MKSEGVFPNSVTFLCILRGCTNIETIEKGQGLHMEVVKEDFEKDPVIGSALVDMYVKCGSLSKAQDLFDWLPYHDVVSWNTLIVGYKHLKQFHSPCLHFISNQRLENYPQEHPISTICLFNMCTQSEALCLR